MPVQDGGAGPKASGVSDSVGATDGKPPSPWEPVYAVRRIPIRDNGEPLVDLRAACPDLMIEQARFRYERVFVGRRTVVEMLAKVDAYLRPRGGRLALVECWRPPHIQSRMYRAAWNMWRERHPDWSDVQIRRVCNRFTAPIGDPRCPPPHSSGGAVDVVLADAVTGVVRDHSSPYAFSDTRAFPFDARGLSAPAQAARLLLGEAMTSAGFTNYPSEFWHWSYGDQGWAYRGGHPNAIYGPTAPEGYVPKPEDLIDAPLEFILDSE